VSSPGHFARSSYKHKQIVFRHPHRYQPSRGFSFPFSKRLYIVSGTVLNPPSGDGSGITVNLVNWSTNAVVATTTTAVGGGFSFSTYDNTDQFVCVAVFDSTHVGASNEGQAV
jgi:hypothetical protein